MRALAALLLLGVFLRHDTAFTVAQMTGWTPGGVFYVAGALWEMLLCAVVLFFVWASYREGLWRSLGIAAAIIGIVEAAMSAGCQMAINGRPPPNMTQCDYVTGLPVFALSMGIEVAVLFWIVGSSVWKQKNGDRAKR